MSILVLLEPYPIKIRTRLINNNILICLIWNVVDY